MAGGHTPFGTRAAGAPGLGGGGGGNPTDSAPLAPGSAQFAGAGSLSLATGVPVPNNNGLTLAFWVKHPGGGANIPNLITQTTNPSAAANNMFFFGFEGGLGLTRWVCYASDTTNSSPGGTAIDADTNWHSVVLVYEDSVLNAPTTKHYVDNIASAPAGGMDLPMHTNEAACSFIIGSGFGDGFGSAAGGSTCNIDSLFVWQRALTAGEATQVWNGGVGLDYSGLSGTLLTNLYAAYNLDGPVSGFWPDSSGNGHHLTITGTVTVGNPRNT